MLMLERPQTFNEQIGQFLSELDEVAHAVEPG
jgi:hypothetical protein